MSNHSISVSTAPVNSDTLKSALEAEYFEQFANFIERLDDPQRHYIYNYNGWQVFRQYDTDDSGDAHYHIEKPDGEVIWLWANFEWVAKDYVKAIVKEAEIAKWKAAYDAQQPASDDENGGAK